MIGVDEAGRGSLVGEMMVAAFAVEKEKLGLLERLGVNDSKKLTPRERERLYWELARIGKFVVVPVRPREIDERNLNELTGDAVVTGLGILKRRLQGRPVERIVIDKFGSSHGLELRVRRLGYHAPVILEEKADEKYLEVAAASIIAKRTRDVRISVLRKMYGVEGSGYPSDPRTVSWVLRVIESGHRPPVIRYSWSTLKGTEAYVRKGKMTSGKGRGGRRTLDEFLG
ncbi:ribonuclease HII [Stetteria hydrogenophila]